MGRRSRGGLRLELGVSFCSHLISLLALLGGPEWDGVLGIRPPFVACWYGATNFQCSVLQSYMVPYLLIPAAQVPTSSGPGLVRVSPPRPHRAGDPCATGPGLDPASQEMPHRGAWGCRFSSGRKITSSAPQPPNRASQLLPAASPCTLLSLACFLRGAYRAWRVRSTLPP